MITQKQSNFVKLLLSKKGYHSEDWKWLATYSKKQAGKLIDKLLHGEQWGEWVAEFMAQLPPPTEKKKRRQAFLPLPDLDPVPVNETPDEKTQFKRWARGVYQRGEQTIEQLFEIYWSRFGNPFAICRLPVDLPVKLP